MLLQKAGAARQPWSPPGSAPRGSPRPPPWSRRLAAVSLVEWNPFVAERLLMGHWPVLLGYAVLPWLVLAGSRGRAAGPVPLAVLVAAPARQPERRRRAGLGGRRCSPSGRRGARPGRCAVSAALVLAANAPWLVSGLLHASTATSDAAGAEVFALRGRGRCRRRWPPSVSAGSGTRRWCRGRAPGCWPGSRWWRWSSSPRSACGPGRRRGAVGTCWQPPSAGCWAGAWPC